MTKGTWLNKFWSKIKRQNEKVLLYPKGHQVNCVFCNDRILTTVCDIHLGDYFGEAHIDQTKGQAPWYRGDLMCCRKCGTPFTALPILQARKKEK